MGMQSKAWVVSTVGRDTTIRRNRILISTNRANSMSRVEWLMTTCGDMRSGIYFVHSMALWVAERRKLRYPDFERVGSIWLFVRPLMASIPSTPCSSLPFRHRRTIRSPSSDCAGLKYNASRTTRYHKNKGGQRMLVSMLSRLRSK